MDIIWQLLLFGGFMFVMMKFGCGSHMFGHGRRKASGAKPHDDANHGSSETNSPALVWVPPMEDTDPVCKKSVVTANGKSSVFGGSVYYFCSHDCREIFERAPDRYVTPGAPLPSLGHSHG